jgi:hypothetical protein
VWNTRSYKFRFSGVKQPPAFNEVVAGRAVAVSFSLGGNFGLAIFNEGSPSFEQIACGASAGAAPIAPTGGAPSGSLIYKPEVDRYAYATKTDRSWPGRAAASCSGSMTDPATSSTSLSSNGLETTGGTGLGKVPGGVRMRPPRCHR